MPNEESITYRRSKVCNLLILRRANSISDRLLETLAQKESIPFHVGRSTKSPAEAVADILEIQKRNRLGGLKIKDLIHEGHKY